MHNLITTKTRLVVSHRYTDRACHRTREKAPGRSAIARALSFSSRKAQIISRTPPRNARVTSADHASRARSCVYLPTMALFPGRRERERERGYGAGRGNLRQGVRLRALG